MSICQGRCVCARNKEITTRLLLIKVKEEISLKLEGKEIFCKAEQRLE